MKYYEIPGWFNGYEHYDKAVDFCPLNGKILEIGCFYGRSTNYMCTNIVNTNRMDINVWALDTFKGSSEHAILKNFVGSDGTFYEATKKHLSTFIDEGFLHLIKSRSDDQKTLDSFDEGFFDAIIVDGAHEYEAVMEDINNWWPKLKDKGIMLFDDMYMESVDKATRDALKDKVPDYMIMQGREAYGMAYKGENQENREKYIKITPENYFK